MVRFCSCGVMAQGCSGESDFLEFLCIVLKINRCGLQTVMQLGLSTQDTSVHLRMSVLVLSCRPGIVREYETHAFIC